MHEIPNHQTLTGCPINQSEVRPLNEISAGSFEFS
jgi:hypothetical protein